MFNQIIQMFKRLFRRVKQEAAASKPVTKESISISDKIIKPGSIRFGRRACSGASGTCKYLVLKYGTKNMQPKKNAYRHIELMPKSEAMLKRERNYRRRVRRHIAAQEAA